ncbi:hypothetical protein LIER_32001 [Lithospermum erythrorhizon]|uniref:Copia protein n=1 Tax=Lithospermum erythrorhizon TaxID=34254 RepID=A0AAV3RSP7_LITER
MFSVEAEYRSATMATCELRWISYILIDLQQPLALPFPLWCDNQTATHTIENLVFHERTKHIELDCHLIRDYYKEGFLCLAMSRLKNSFRFVHKKLANPGV